VNRLLSLDVLRGVAVLLVLITHSDSFNHTLLAPLRRGGWVGVDLFFVLSGFLVSGLLFREFQTTGKIEPVRFLLRRGWKIYPAFWLMIGFSVCFWGLMYGQWDPARTLAELTFVQSYVKHRWWNHTWSLAVEEHFYLLLPFLLLALTRENFKSLPRIVLWLMAGCLAIRLANAARPFSEQTHMWATHLRLDGLFLGVLLCYWHNTWEAFNAFCRRYASWLIAIGIGLLLPPCFVEQEHPFIHTVGLTLNSLGSAALLMGMVSGSVRENWLSKSVGWIGFYSYSIYLWHNLVIFTAAPLLGIANPMLFSIVGSIAVGVALANLVELPLLKLRDAKRPAVAVA
jgi:peptidoglycan/LPS O-acetylase OafA/YrhL